MPDDLDFLWPETPAVPNLGEIANSGPRLACSAGGAAPERPGSACDVADASAPASPRFRRSVDHTGAFWPKEIARYVQLSLRNSNSDPPRKTAPCQCRSIAPGPLFRLYSHPACRPCRRCRRSGVSEFYVKKRVWCQLAHCSRRLARVKTRAQATRGDWGWWWWCIRQSVTVVGWSDHRPATAATPSPPADHQTPAGP